MVHRRLVTICAVVGLALGLSSCGFFDEGTPQQQVDHAASTAPSGSQYQVVDLNAETGDNAFVQTIETDGYLTATETVCRDDIEATELIVDATVSHNGNLITADRVGNDVVLFDITGISSFEGDVLIGFSEAMFADAFIVNRSLSGLVRVPDGVSLEDTLFRISRNNFGLKNSDQIDTITLCHDDSTPLLPLPSGSQPDSAETDLPIGDQSETTSSPDDQSETTSSPDDQAETTSSPSVDQSESTSSPSE